jgi:hypothetical protein
MSAKDRLFDTYAEWRRWTEEEGDAIRQSDWPKVHSCQRAKLELQPRIMKFTDDARTETVGTGTRWEDIEKDLRREVASLIQMETRNGQVLDTVRRLAQAEQAELDRSRRQLQRVRSYAPVRTSVWSSYS